MNPRLQNKIAIYIQQDPDSGCWIWHGQISNSGHGRLMIKSPDNRTYTESAENVSYMGYIGEIPQGHYARQTCGNRLCVNPEHLQLTPYPDHNK